MKTLGQFVGRELVVLSHLPVEIVVLPGRSYLDILWLCPRKYPCGTVSHVGGYIVYRGKVATYIWRTLIAESHCRCREHGPVVGGLDYLHRCGVKLRLYIYEVFEHSRHPAEVISVIRVERFGFLAVEIEVSQREHCHGVLFAVLGEQFGDTIIPVEIIDYKLSLIQLSVYLRLHFAIEECLVEHHEGLPFACQFICRLYILHYVNRVAHSRYIIVA